jgi:hypothetical protein
MLFQIMSGSKSFDNLSSLTLMRTSESFSDLNAELSGASVSRPAGRSSLAGARASGNPATAVNNGNNGGNALASGAEECNNNNNNSSSNGNNNNKPFGLGE